MRVSIGNVMHKGAGSARVRLPVLQVSILKFRVTGNYPVALLDVLSGTGDDSYHQRYQARVKKQQGELPAANQVEKLDKKELQEEVE